MNAAFFEDREFDVEFDDSQTDGNRPQEKFRMARRPQGDPRKRPKQFNGIHRRRRKKIRL
jgi:hypothetical protein